MWGDEPNGTVDDVICIRVADFDRVTSKVRDTGFTLRAIPLAQRRGRELQEGDLLLEKSGGGELQPVGKVVLYNLPYQAICSNFIARMRPLEDYDPRFLNYLFDATYVGRLNVNSLKQNTGIQNLDSNSYLSERAGFPPNEEQRAIAAFLDRETARLDTLIAKNEQLIERLQEKRTALISRAVTKGLDANVPMKDSGVEWLGEVPEGWEVKRIRDIAESLQTGPFGSQLHSDEYSSGGIPVINPAHLRDGKIFPDLNVAVDEATFARLSQHELREGDIVFARRGEMGRCALVTKKESGWLCGSGSMRVRPKHNEIHPQFFNRVLSTNGISDWLLLESVGTTMDNLNRKIVGGVPLPRPPIDEQRAIAEYLDKQTARLDALVAKIQDAIARLREYRGALIAAAVTGKVDVRDTA